MNYMISGFFIFFCFSLRYSSLGCWQSNLESNEVGWEKWSWKKSNIQEVGNVQRGKEESFLSDLNIFLSELLHKFIYFYLWNIWLYIRNIIVFYTPDINKVSSLSRLGRNICWQYTKEKPKHEENAEFLHFVKFILKFYVTITLLWPPAYVVTHSLPVLWLTTMVIRSAQAIASGIFVG